VTLSNWAYGFYPHRARGARARATAGIGEQRPDDHFEQPPPKPARPSRASWARLMKRILEIDPLLWIRCLSRRSLQKNSKRAPPA
jgi:hypothetical protein